MATAMGSYEEWLTQKLTSLSPEFDTDVFVSYIVSILDTDSTSEETTESIEEILSQFLEGDECGAACKEIVAQWNQHNSEALAAAASAVKKDAGDVLSEIMEHQTLATVKESKQTAEEKAHKEAILAQYAQVSDGEETDEEQDMAANTSHKGKGDGALLERNMNSAIVVEAQQAQREQSRQDHERKKEKDKQDREAQKQKQQQRKEAEKKRTQKGERRR